MPADTDHSSTHAQRGFAPKRIKSVVRNRRKKTITPWSCIVSGLRHAASQGVASIVSIPVLVTALCLTKHPQEASEVQTQIQSLHSGDDLLERRFNDDERYLLAEELESKNKVAFSLCAHAYIYLVTHPWQEIGELNLALNRTTEENTAFIQQRDDAMRVRICSPIMKRS
ncbi:hypothetical protein C0992_009216 [Termitomyces sp. T32_za158]|nr:hypothetical protein C0992_009216 [Termitomyces sp. T32_za158]